MGFDASGCTYKKGKKKEDEVEEGVASAAASEEAPKISKGREYVSKILDASGQILVTTGSILSIALAIKELRS